MRNQRSDVPNQPNNFAVNLLSELDLLQLPELDSVLSSRDEEAKDYFRPLSALFDIAKNSELRTLMEVDAYFQACQVVAQARQSSGEGETQDARHLYVRQAVDLINAGGGTVRTANYSQDLLSLVSRRYRPFLEAQWLRSYFPEDKDQRFARRLLNNSRYQRRANSAYYVLHQEKFDSPQSALRQFSSELFITEKQQVEDQWHAVQALPAEQQEAAKQQLYEEYLTAYQQAKRQELRASASDERELAQQSLAAGLQLFYYSDLLKRSGEAELDIDQLEETESEKSARQGRCLHLIQSLLERHQEQARLPGQEPNRLAAKLKLYLQLYAEEFGFYRARNTAELHQVFELETIPVALPFHEINEALVEWTVVQEANEAPEGILQQFDQLTRSFWEERQEAILTEYAVSATQAFMTHLGLAGQEQPGLEGRGAINRALSNHGDKNELRQLAGIVLLRLEFVEAYQGGLLPELLSYRQTFQTFYPTLTVANHFGLSANKVAEEVVYQKNLLEKRAELQQREQVFDQQQGGIYHAFPTQSLAIVANSLTASERLLQLGRRTGVLEEEESVQQQIRSNYQPLMNCMLNALRRQLTGVSFSSAYQTKVNHLKKLLKGRELKRHWLTLFSPGQAQIPIELSRQELISELDSIIDAKLQQLRALAVDVDGERFIFASPEQKRNYVEARTKLMEFLPNTEAVNSLWLEYDQSQQARHEVRRLLKNSISGDLSELLSLRHDNLHVAPLKTSGGDVAGEVFNELEQQPSIYNDQFGEHYLYVADPVRSMQRASRQGSNLFQPLKSDVVANLRDLTANIEEAYQFIPDDAFQVFVHFILEHGETEQLENLRALFGEQNHQDAVSLSYHPEGRFFYPSTLTLDYFPNPESRSWPVFTAYMREISVNLLAFNIRYKAVNQVIEQLASSQVDVFQALNNPLFQEAMTTADQLQDLLIELQSVNQRYEEALGSFTENAQNARSTMVRMQRGLETMATQVQQDLTPLANALVDRFPADKLYEKNALGFYQFTLASDEYQRIYEFINEHADQAHRSNFLLIQPVIHFLNQTQGGMASEYTQSSVTGGINLARLVEFCVRYTSDNTQQNALVYFGEIFSHRGDSYQALLESEASTEFAEWLSGHKSVDELVDTTNAYTQLAQHATQLCSGVDFDARQWLQTSFTAFFASNRMTRDARLQGVLQFALPADELARVQAEDEADIEEAAVWIATFFRVPPPESQITPERFSDLEGKLGWLLDYKSEQSRYQIETAVVPALQAYAENYKGESLYNFGTLIYSLTEHWQARPVPEAVTNAIAQIAEKRIRFLTEQAEDFMPQEEDDWRCSEYARIQEEYGEPIYEQVLQNDRDLLTCSMGFPGLTQRIQHYIGDLVGDAGFSDIPQEQRNSVYALIRQFGSDEQRLQLGRYLFATGLENQIDSEEVFIVLDQTFEKARDRQHCVETLSSEWFSELQQGLKEANFYFYFYYEVLSRFDINSRRLQAILIQWLQNELAETPASEFAVSPLVKEVENFLIKTELQETDLLKAWLQKQFDEQLEEGGLDEAMLCQLAELIIQYGSSEEAIECCKRLIIIQINSPALEDLNSFVSAGLFSKLNDLAIRDHERYQAVIAGLGHWLHQQIEPIAEDERLFQTCRSLIMGLGNDDLKLNLLKKHTELLADAQRSVINLEEVIYQLELMLQEIDEPNQSQFVTDFVDWLQVEFQLDLYSLSSEQEESLRQLVERINNHSLVALRSDLVVASLRRCLEQDDAEMFETKLEEYREALAIPVVRDKAVTVVKNLRPKSRVLTYAGYHPKQWSPTALVLGYELIEQEESGLDELKALQQREFANWLSDVLQAPELLQTYNKTRPEAHAENQRQLAALLASDELSLDLLEAELGESRLKKIVFSATAFMTREADFGAEIKILRQFVSRLTDVDFVALRSEVSQAEQVLDESAATYQAAQQRRHSFWSGLWNGVLNWFGAGDDRQQTLDRARLNYQAAQQAYQKALARFEPLEYLRNQAQATGRSSLSRCFLQLDEFSGWLERRENPNEELLNELTQQVDDLRAHWGHILRQSESPFNRFGFFQEEREGQQTSFYGAFYHDVALLQQRLLKLLQQGIQSGWDLSYLTPVIEKLADYVVIESDDAVYFKPSMKQQWLRLLAPEQRFSEVESIKTQLTYIEWVIDKLVDKVTSGESTLADQFASLILNDSKFARDHLELALQWMDKDRLLNLQIKLQELIKFLQPEQQSLLTQNLNLLCDLMQPLSAGVNALNSQQITDQLDQWQHNYERLQVNTEHANRYSNYLAEHLTDLSQPLINSEWSEENWETIIDLIIHYADRDHRQLIDETLAPYLGQLLYQHQQLRVEAYRRTSADTDSYQATDLEHWHRISQLLPLLTEQTRVACQAQLSDLVSNTLGTVRTRIFSIGDWLSEDFVGPNEATRARDLTYFSEAVQLIEQLGSDVQRKELNERYASAYRKYLWHVIKQWQKGHLPSDAYCSNLERLLKTHPNYAPLAEELSVLRRQLGGSSAHQQEAYQTYVKTCYAQLAEKVTPLLELLSVYWEQREQLAYTIQKFVQGAGFSSEQMTNLIAFRDFMVANDITHIEGVNRELLDDSLRETYDHYLQNKSSALTALVEVSAQLIIYGRRSDSFVHLAGNIAEIKQTLTGWHRGAVRLMGEVAKVNSFLQRLKTIEPARQSLFDSFGLTQEQIDNWKKQFDSFRSELLQVSGRAFRESTRLFKSLQEEVFRWMDIEISEDMSPEEEEVLISLQTFKQEVDEKFTAASPEDVAANLTRLERQAGSYGLLARRSSQQDLTYTENLQLRVDYARAVAQGQPEAAMIELYGVQCALETHPEVQITGIPGNIEYLRQSVRASQVFVQEFKALQATLQEGGAQASSIGLNISTRLAGLPLVLSQEQIEHLRSLDLTEVVPSNLSSSEVIRENLRSILNKALTLDECLSEQPEINEVTQEEIDAVNGNFSTLRQYQKLANSLIELDNPKAAKLTHLTPESVRDLAASSWVSSKHDSLVRVCSHALTQIDETNEAMHVSAVRHLADFIEQITPELTERAIEVFQNLASRYVEQVREECQRLENDSPAQLLQLLRQFSQGDPPYKGMLFVIQQYGRIEDQERLKEHLQSYQYLVQVYYYVSQADEHILQGEDRYSDLLQQVQVGEAVSNRLSAETLNEPVARMGLNKTRLRNGAYALARLNRQLDSTTGYRSVMEKVVEVDALMKQFEEDELTIEQTETLVQLIKEITLEGEAFHKTLLAQSLVEQAPSLTLLAKVADSTLRALERVSHDDRTPSHDTLMQQLWQLILNPDESVVENYERFISDLMTHYHFSGQEEKTVFDSKVNTLQLMLRKRYLANHIRQQVFDGAPSSFEKLFVESALQPAQVLYSDQQAYRWREYNLLKRIRHERQPLESQEARLSALRSINGGAIEDSFSDEHPEVGKEVKKAKRLRRLIVESREDTVEVSQSREELASSRLELERHVREKMLNADERNEIEQRIDVLEQQYEQVVSGQLEDEVLDLEFQEAFNRHQDYFQHCLFVLEDRAPYREKKWLQDKLLTWSFTLVAALEEQVEQLKLSEDPEIKQRVLSVTQAVQSQLDEEVSAAYEHDNDSLAQEFRHSYSSREFDAFVKEFNLLDCYGYHSQEAINKVFIELEANRPTMQPSETTALVDRPGMQVAGAQLGRLSEEERERYQSRVRSIQQSLVSLIPEKAATRLVDRLAGSGELEQTNSASATAQPDSSLQAALQYRLTHTEVLEAGQDFRADRVMGPGFAPPATGHD